MKHVLMVEFTQDKVADLVEPDVRSTFGVLTHMVKAKQPRVKSRGWQISADDLLSETCRLRTERQADYAIGFTAEDLFVPDMNFVFGLASADGRCAVVSSNRLKPGDPRIFRDRLLKEVVHELGHAFGMNHCPDPKCVMHFSNSLQDTDSKASTFCAKCESLLVR